MSQPYPFDPDRDSRPEPRWSPYPYGHTQASPQPYVPWQPQGQVQPPPTAPTRTGTEEDSFFSALFDLSFTRFVTIGFVRLVYLFGMAACAVLWLVLTIVGFVNEIGIGIAALLLGWIPALLLLLMMRVGMEFTVATVRTAQNTGAIAASMDVLRD